jgi:hypothetical protein
MTGTWILSRQEWEAIKQYAARLVKQPKNREISISWAADEIGEANQTQNLFQQNDPLNLLKPKEGGISDLY